VAALCLVFALLWILVGGLWGGLSVDERRLVGGGVASTAAARDASLVAS
jgi:hypothetical protein